MTKFEIAFNCTKNNGGVFTCSVEGNTPEEAYKNMHALCKSQNYDLVSIVYVR